MKCFIIKHLVRAVYVPKYCRCRGSNYNCNWTSRWLSIIIHDEELIGNYKFIISLVSLPLHGAISQTVHSAASSLQCSLTCTILMTVAGLHFWKARSTFILLNTDAAPLLCLTLDIFTSLRLSANEVWEFYSSGIYRLDLLIVKQRQWHAIYMTWTRNLWNRNIQVEWTTESDKWDSKLAIQP